MAESGAAREAKRKAKKNKLDLFVKNGGLKQLGFKKSINSLVN